MGKLSYTTPQVQAILDAALQGDTAIKSSNGKVQKITWDLTNFDEFLTGELHYDPIEKTFSFLSELGQNIQINKEQFQIVRNHNAYPLLEGRLVRITGFNGTYFTVDYADYSTEVTASWDGMLTTTIPAYTGSNDEECIGSMTTNGFVNGIITTGCDGNEDVYLTSQGQWSCVKPTGKYYIRNIGKIGIGDSVDGSIYIRWSNETLGDVQGALADSGMPHGIPASQKNNIVMSYVPSGRTVTITGDFYIYNKSIKYIIDYTTGNTITHVNTTGLHFIYLDCSTGEPVLTTSMTSWTLGEIIPLAIINYNSSSATTFWNGVDGKLLCERHGSVMDKASHTEFHENMGCYATTGFGLGGYTSGSGSGGLVANSFSVSTGTVKDEDNWTILPSLPDNEGVGNNYNIYYKLGSEWRWYKNNLPYLFQNTNILYNQITSGSGSLNEITNNGYYMNIWIVGMPMLDNTTGLPTNNGFGFIVGQNQYTSLALAQASSFFDLDLSGFPSAEIAPLWQIIFQRQSSYDDNGNCRIETVRRIVGTRFISGSAGTSPSIHNNLSGRNALDCHPISSITDLSASLTALSGFTLQNVTNNGSTASVAGQISLSGNSGLVLAGNGGGITLNTTQSAGINFNATSCAGITMTTDAASGSINLISQNNTVPIQIKANNGGIYLQTLTTGGNGIQLSSDKITLSGTSAKYYDDYSSSYTDRSLVDKGYVTGLTIGKYLPISGGTMTGNLYGTTISATTISGGTLYGNGSNITGLNYGNVTGTTSSTNNSIVTFNSTSGKLIKAYSGATIDDNGNLSVMGNSNFTLGYNSGIIIGGISGTTDSIKIGINGTYNNYIDIKQSVTSLNSQLQYTSNASTTFYDRQIPDVNAVISFITGSTIGKYLPISGGTMTGNLYGTTISATTISGGTLYGNGSNLTGLPSSTFTGGTVTGNTIFTTNLSANTISATTISGGTLYGNGSNLTGLVPSTRLIISNNTVGSVIGGGDLTSDRTLKLEGDSVTPGNSKYYGTNSSGTKGFYDLPSGSTGSTTYTAGSGITISGNAISVNIIGLPLDETPEGTDFIMYQSSGGTLERAAINTLPVISMFRYSLPEGINNTAVYFYSWSKTSTATNGIRSGNNAGLPYADACSPIVVNNDGFISEASLVLGGAGVQAGSPVYPVIYSAEVWSVGFASEGTLRGTLTWSIPSGNTVGGYSVSTTNYKGSTGNVNIPCSAGDLLAVKFVNGNSASSVGQMLNAFITIKFKSN